MPGSATLKASVVKRVNCVCGKSYHYLLELSQTGYFHGFAKTQAEADERAAERAASELAQRLATECGLCRCPTCGLLTPEMEAKRAADRTNHTPDAVRITAIGLVVLAAVYAGWAFLGRLYYVLGMVGIVVTGGGFLQILSGYSEEVLPALAEDDPRILDRGTAASGRAGPAPISTENPGGGQYPSAQL